VKPDTDSENVAVMGIEAAFVVLVAVLASIAVGPFTCAIAICHVLAMATKNAAAMIAPNAVNMRACIVLIRFFMTINE
jgi:hypothetical protein